MDRCDRVYVCGWGGMVNGRDLPTVPAYSAYLDGNGTTAGLPVTTNAAQPATDGSDFYLAQFSAGLTRLDYATFYGDTTPNTEGEHVDGGTSRFDPRGLVYEAVCSCFSTAGFPIPPGANTYSTVNGSSIAGFGANCNNAAFVLDFLPSVADAGPDQSVCANAGPQALVGNPGGGIWTGRGVMGGQAVGYVFTPSAALVGVNTLTYTLPNTGLCTSTGTRLETVLPPPSAGADTVLCGNNLLPFRLRGTPAGGTFSGPGVSGSMASGFLFMPPANLTGSVTITYTIGSNVCSGTATRAISVAPVPVLAPTQVAVPCPETQLAPLVVQFALGSGAAGLVPTWEFGDGTQSTEASPAHTYATPGTYQPRLRVRYLQARCETLVALAPVTVRERIVPNIITPNGDEKNQTFKLGPDCIPRLQMYSRWGQLVFDSPAYHDDWSAAGQADGVYYYLLTYPDGHRVKGWVEVRR